MLTVSSAFTMTMHAVSTVTEWQHLTRVSSNTDFWQLSYWLFVTLPCVLKVLCCELRMKKLVRFERKKLTLFQLCWYLALVISRMTAQPLTPWAVVWNIDDRSGNVVASVKHGQWLGVCSQANTGSASMYQATISTGVAMSTRHTTPSIFVVRSLWPHEHHLSLTSRSKWVVLRLFMTQVNGKHRKEYVFNLAKHKKKKCEAM